MVALAAAWMLYQYARNGKPKLGELPPVSIVICARNEDETLRQNLPYIFQQQYQVFEVIVVNDGSTDLTGKVLEVFQRRYDNLWVVTCTGAGNKKQALDAGIRAAKYDTILLTDADCRPQGPYWVAAMANCFDKETDIVLGFSPYLSQKGFLNKLIRFETLHTAYLYGGFALLGLPYMGVGRNLAYRKEIYFKSNARQKFKETLSGDDDLLVNEMAHRSNTKICGINEGIVWSSPKTTWPGWWHQKRRHLSAGVQYNWGTKALLGLVHLPVLLVYVLIVIFILLGVIVNPINFFFAGMLLTVRSVLLYIGLPTPVNVLEQASLLPFVLICDFLLSLILFSLGCLSAIKVRTWTN